MALNMTLSAAAAVGTGRGRGGTGSDHPATPANRSEYQIKGPKIITFGIIAGLKTLLTERLHRRKKHKASGGVLCRTCQGVLHAGSCISLKNSRLLCVLGCHWKQLRYQPEQHQLACCFANCVNMHPPQSATAPDIPWHSEHSVALQLSCRLPLNAVMHPLHTTPVSATCPLMCSL